MDSDTFNSKIDFLNQIMENEITQNTNNEANEELNKRKNTNEETGTDQDSQANNNQTDDGNEEEEEEGDEEENDDDNEENQSENNSLDESMNPDDQSSSFDENNQDVNLNETQLPPLSNKDKQILNEKNLDKHHHHHKEKKAKKHAKIIVPNVHNSIKSFYGTNNNLLYTIPTYSFSQFETMLFDLVGFAPISSFKAENIRPDEPEVSILKKLDNFNSNENSAAIISDMNILNENLTNDVFRKAKLKSNESLKMPKLIKSSIKQSTKTEEEKFKHAKSKIITVILNQTNGDLSSRRRANRILLSKRNTTSMDTVLNEISNLFKIDSSNVRRLFGMDGNQVNSLIDLLELDVVFLVIGSEKTHSKDFHLDQEEIDKYFANELMKNIFSVKLAKLNEKKQEQVSTSQIDQKDITNNSNEIINLMPDELLNNYEIGDEIGYGHYAMVRAVKDINTGYEFALKIVDLKKCIGKENMIENELDILRKIKHPNIVKLVEEYKTDDYFYLIMEYLKGGDLLEALTAQEKYSEKEASILVQSLASAIAYLHENKIVHRDIKLENILVNKNSEGNLTAVKLGDFGLATKLESGLLNQKCGSPVYVAPEVLFGRDYSLEVDVWSLGIIMYILLVGFAPFQGETDDATFELIKTAELAFLPPYWDDITEDAKDLIRKMLDRNQETRIKARDVLKHKWVTGVDESNKKLDELKLKQVKSSDSLLSNLTSSVNPTKENGITNSKKQQQTNQVNKKLNEKLSNINKVYKSSLVIPK